MRVTSPTPAPASSRAKADPWLAYHVPQPQAWARLFCLPHAGGSASLFRTWQAELGSELEVCPVQLPGRESRLHEPPLKDLPAVVERLVELVRRHDDRPFALFGHSMGGLLAFELTRALRDRGLPLPLHLYVASYCAPHTLRRSPEGQHTHDIDVCEARRMGAALGLPEDMSEELLTLMRSTVLADTAVCEGYTWRPCMPLPCPLSAFRGSEDYVPEDQTLAWKELTSGPFSTQCFLGDHFFLRQTPRGMLQTVRRGLARLRPPAPLPSPSSASTQEPNP